MTQIAIKIEFEDRRLQELSDQLQAKARQVVLIAAHNTERRAKELVPVDTGATKNSIEVHPGPGDAEASVGPSTEYAPFLEFGTRRMAARPFMVPAAEAERGPFMAALKAIVEGQG